jgi:hypothetical protein
MNRNDTQSLYRQENLSPTLHPEGSPMKRTATAVWQGTLKKGKGAIVPQSKVLNDTPYSFRSPFRGGF